NYRLVFHGQQVLGELESVLSSLKDLETGQRGYLLTRDENYLAPYQRALPLIDSSLDAVARLTADNPRQQVVIPELRRVVAEKIAELGETLALRAQKGQEHALRVVRSDRGRRAMGRARQLISAMKAEENQLLGRRSAESRVALWLTISAFGL